MGLTLDHKWNNSIIVSIICRLLWVLGVLGFVALMVCTTGKLSCLWLLWLLLAVEYIPVYEFKTKRTDDVIDEEAHE